MPGFAKATAWLHGDEGLRKTYPALARVKLGGIHRAQPFSHYFDAGTYSHYFLAEWALRSRPEQVAAYEVLRDGRAKLPDVVHGAGRRFAGRVPDHDARGFGDFGGVGDMTGAMLGAEAAAMDGGLAVADAGFAAAEAAAGVLDSESACGAACGANCGSGCGSS